MFVKPLSRNINRKAKDIGLNTITLQFSAWGGEVKFDIELNPPRPQITTEDLCELLSEIEEWALHVYSNYSSDEDFYPYGVDICYDLIKSRVATSKWFTERKEGDRQEQILELEED